MKKIIRFDIQDMLPIGLTFVVLGIGLTYGINVMGDIKSDFCVGTREHMARGVCYVCNDSSWDNFQASEASCSNGTIGTAGIVNYTAVVGGDASVNASVHAIEGVAKLPEKMPLIATVVVAAIIIGILVRYLMVRFT